MHGINRFVSGHARELMSSEGDESWEITPPDQLPFFFAEFSFLPSLPL